MSPGTRQVRLAPSPQWAPMGLAPVVLAMPQSGLGPTGSLPWIGQQSRLWLPSQIIAVESGLIPPRMPHLLQQFLAQKPPYLPCLNISLHPLLYLQFLLSIVRARRFPDAVCAMSRDHSHPSREERMRTGECEGTGCV